MSWISAEVDRVAGRIERAGDDVQDFVDDVTGKTEAKANEKANELAKQQADLDNYIARRRQLAAARKMQANISNVAAQTGQAGGSGALGSSASVASQEAASLGTQSQLIGLDNELFKSRQETNERLAKTNTVMAGIQLGASVYGAI